LLSTDVLLPTAVATLSDRLMYYMVTKQRYTDGHSLLLHCKWVMISLKTRRRKAAETAGRKDFIYKKLSTFQAFH